MEGDSAAFALRSPDFGLASSHDREKDHPRSGRGPGLGAADVANDAARVTRYRALIQEGLEDLDAGRFEVVEDIDAWLDTLGRRPPE